MQNKKNMDLSDYLENQIIALEEIETLLFKVIDFIEDIPDFSDDVFSYWDTCQDKKFNTVLGFVIADKIKNLKTSTDNLIKEV